MCICRSQSSHPLRPRLLLSTLCLLCLFSRYFPNVFSNYCMYQLSTKLLLWVSSFLTGIIWYNSPPANCLSLLFLLKDPQFTVRPWPHWAVTSRPPSTSPPRATSFSCAGQLTTAPIRRGFASAMSVSIKVCIHLNLFIACTFSVSGLEFEWACVLWVVDMKYF